MASPCPAWLPLAEATLKAHPELAARFVRTVEALTDWYRTLDPHQRAWLAAGRCNGPRPMPAGAITWDGRRRRHRRRP